MSRLLKTWRQISGQLCDEVGDVWFNKERCRVNDSNEKEVLTGLRSKDNCYCANAREATDDKVCHKASNDVLELWHKRLGHMNFRDLLKLSAPMRGLPKLGGKQEGACEGCKSGKQTRSPHKPIKCISTTCHPLELLHMDLVGPMQTESIGGKKSILALVDSFSWVSFLHDKSEAFKSKCAINVQ